MFDMKRIERAMRNEYGPDQQAIADTGVKIVDLLLRKNTDYGGSAWQSPVLCPEMPADVAMLVRASDKIARLQRLRSVKGEVPESFVDSCADLAGYMVLLVAWLLRKDECRADQMAEEAVEGEGEEQVYVCDEQGGDQ